MKKTLFCGALVLSLPSFAQEMPTIKDSLSEKPISLDEVVVQGIRARENTPISFSNVSKKEIQQKNAGQQLPLLLVY